VRWLLFAVVLALSAACAALGAWLGGKSKRTATIAAAVGLSFLLLRLVLRFVPTLEYALLPYDWYAVVRPWWAMPPGFIVLALGPRHMSTPLSRKGVAVFAVLVGCVAVEQLWITARWDPATVKGKVERDGVCMQTTDYTCGAASAVMLLDQVAKIRTDERDMAERSWTNALTGTDELCVCRGLRQKLEGTGREVVFEHADWPRLRALGRPAMATVAYSFMVDHWVVVLEVRDDEVVLMDPLAGRTRRPLDEFVKTWRGDLIWIR
jgi:hypothetical protein